VPNLKMSLCKKGTDGCVKFVFSVDDEPPGEEKGGGDLAKNVAESVTTINSSEDGIDDGIIL